MNKTAIACCIFACLSPILTGYDTGVMSGAVIYIQKELKISETQVEVLMGIINLHSLIGSLAAGRISDWLGRRYTVMISGAIFFVGALLTGIATNYAFLMVGRFVAGIGVGFALTIASVYTAELAPALSRGFLASFPELFINVGLLLGYTSNYAFSGLPTHLAWRMMVGVGAIPAAALIIGILFMPESPRWLVIRGHLGEARKVLNKICESNEEAQNRLRDIKEVAGIPQDRNDDIVRVTKSNHSKGIWKELFVHPTASVRHILIAALGIRFFNEACGLDSIILYGPRIFGKAGIASARHQLLATITVGVVKTALVFVSMFLLDRVGRRPLLLSSVAAMAISLVTLAATFTVMDRSEKKLSWAPVLCIVATLSYVGSFSSGLGPITWVYNSEIFPLRLRALGASVGLVVGKVTSGIIAMTFISLCKAITMGGLFFLFAGVTTVSWIFFYTVLPETQGRTLEETEGLFGKFNCRRG
ncbi:hypothetical protein SLE2022_258580 [Rubroshorea leprosula]